jgi:hypothetical protein
MEGAEVGLTLGQKIEVFDAWLRTPQGIQWLILFCVTFLGIILIGRIVTERILQKNEPEQGTQPTEMPRQEETDFRALRKARDMS